MTIMIASLEQAPLQVGAEDAQVHASVDHDGLDSKGKSIIPKGNPLYVPKGNHLFQREILYSKSKSLIQSRKPFAVSCRLRPRRPRHSTNTKTKTETTTNNANTNTTRANHTTNTDNNNNTYAGRRPRRPRVDRFCVH